jgi:hypothetical protein
MIAQDLDSIVDGMSGRLPADFLELWEVVKTVRDGGRRT